MIKTVITYFLYFSLALILTYALQYISMGQDTSTVRFSIWHINLFFVIISFTICVTLQLISLKPELEPQLGYLYLPTVIIKGILFYIIFRNTVFGIESVNNLERLILGLPLLISLSLEVYLISKILKKKTAEIY
ncbi:DUF6168 family protein [Sediminibacter sp. Hel_I_10]|uniref:DUF6168 family protein n=1 Tax=Sediminibacter sp. Hel_I_10 TaxID=1392490 RepID=UPI001E5E108A|nr:DUF6168 family protein [Sediminibacter sp. Hel_I_10]